MNRDTLIRKAIQVAIDARTHGNHPFGALLVSPEGEILLEAENTVNTEKDATGHAETNAVRMASQRYSRDYLQRCTLVSSAEPCVMCSGAIYWSNIGSLVYALSEASLGEETGTNPENLKMSLPCRDVFAHGQRTIEVYGPMLEDEARVPHSGFWNYSA